MKADLEREALELHVAGWTHSQIADKQNVTAATVRSRISRAIKDRVPAQLVEEARSIETVRLDGLVRFYVTVLTADDVTLDSKFRAAKGLHETIVTRSKLLGLEQPIRVKVEIPTKMDEEIAELLRQFGVQDLLTFDGEFEVEDADKLA